MSTFVSIGNATQPFYRLLHAVEKLADALPQPVIVQYGNTPFQSEKCSCIAFMSMKDFEDAVGKADLLIMHAGAGSVIHALSFRKRPVVMPRRLKYKEHVDDHQREFACSLEEAGKVILAEESADLEKAIDAALSVQAAEQCRGIEPMMVSRVRNALKERTLT